MFEEQRKWKFDEKIAPVFDAHVQQSVPGYARIQESVASMTDFFCESGSVVLDLGCSTGETLVRIKSMGVDKKILCMGVDESPDMIQQAIKKTKGDSDYRFYQDRLEAFEFPSDVSVITSILTMQFVKQRYRLDVLKKIYQSLEPGGAFFFVEKTFAERALVQDLFTQVYHDFKESQGLSKEEIRLKDKSLRGVMLPRTVKENEYLLKEAGFEHVEMFFKDLHFTGWIAIK
ncbi:hypothetical protein JMA_43070 (plasmid) [Jeotgalibacillus malaysiensis]|uniref:Methyltransferase domain-containing protein n=1 Tax=Jeotgalibacillus malaysiensis TaxID=1508404 RepID=A0A0B5B0B5_9BACL|nr:methyltransferase domain-containing protein [Jeotgalibacillus malaysiensis]AJD93624.1 hypothetical protein JMA_43070 [Jeotgalibacillus malaysiensis]